jgi:rRNA maturation RNase YbeY
MIRYYAEGTDLPDFCQTTVTGWIKRVISSHGKLPGEINYIFCNDERILSVNIEFLKHDYYTDIITFDYSKSSVLSGDIYISLDTVASNATKLDLPFSNELNRVMVHGILHLCGFKDKKPDESLEMRKLEDDALEILKA